MVNLALPLAGSPREAVPRGVRRRRRVALGLAVVLLAGTGTWAFVQSAGASRAGKMADLVWAGNGSRAVGSSGNATQLVLGDAVSGTVRRLGGPFMWGCGGCAILRAGNSLFVGEADGIYRLDRPRYRATKIANGQIVFPATVPGQLFVASSICCSPAEHQGDYVHLITTTGKNLGGPWTVPSGYALTDPPRSTASGIVVATVIAAPISPSASLTASPTLAIWNPMTGSIGHVLDLAASFIDTTTADGHTTVAWLRALRGHCFYPAGDCQLVLTDLTTGLDRVIALPPGGLGFIGGGAFSPDGKTLAAFIHPDHILGPGLNGQVMKLVIIDVATGTVRPVPGSLAEYGEPYGFATWSPDGRWMFFGGFSGGGQRRGKVLHHVGAYRIGTTRATELGLPQNYSVVAVQP